MLGRLKKGLLPFIKSPQFIIFCISLVLVTFSIVIIGKFRPFNSDDVYWQLASRHWKPFSGDIFYFGAKDIFVILSPYFAVMESLFTHGRRLLILESLLLVVGSFALYYAAAIYFLRKLKIKMSYPVLLPFVWLASFSYPMVSWYLNPNWRSFEMGLSLATFAVVAALCHKDIVIKSLKSKIAMSLAVILTGMLIYSDPYYTFFTIGPIIISAITLHTLKKIDKITALTLYVGIGASLVLSKLFSALYSAAGVHINTNAPSVFVTFESIVDNILASLHGLFHIFGADFLGRAAASPSTFIAMLNAVLVAFIIFILVGYKKDLRLDKIKGHALASFWPLLLVLTMGLVFAVNTFSTLADSENYRFYMLFAYAAVLLLAIEIGKMKNPFLLRVLTTVLILASIVNVAQTVHKGWINTNVDISSNQSNALNYDIVKSMRALGLTKGYTNFWQANINTYVSDGDITFLPSICNPYGETSKFKWLTTNSEFVKNAKSTFYFLPSNNKYPQTCIKDDLIKQFGQPSNITEIPGGTLLIFDYDISTRMP